MPGWNETLSYSFWIGVGLKSSAVLIAAGLAVIFLRRRSAAARHVIWTGAFAALLVLPVLSISLPALRVRISRAFLPAAVSFEASSSLANVAKSDSAAEPALATHATAKPWHPDWRTTILFLWIFGMALSYGQMLLSWAAIRRIRRTSRSLASSHFSSLAQQLGIRHKVTVLEAGPGSMPMTFGLFRSEVFIPSDALQWAEERRSLVLLHEFAHVRRADCVTHLLARTALSIYWWNPLAWLAWREFLKERERAADDLVLNVGARASEYARHLLEIASGMQLPLTVEWAAVAMARRSQLESRLAAILDPSRNRKGIRHATAISAVVLAMGVAAPLAALQSQNITPSTLPADPAAAIGAATAQRNPEMLDRAAKAAETFRNYDLARKLLDASLALRAQISGEESREYGMGLLNLGNLEREQGKLNVAEGLYTKAVPVLGSTPEAATALIHLGSIALANKNVPEALGDFERAQALNPGDAGRSDMWIAVAQEQQGSMEQADAFYQSAFKKADPDSSGEATAIEVYAQFLQRRGRENEAKSMQDQSAAIRNALGVKAMSTVQSGPNVYKIGGGVTTPVLVSKVEPEYTQDARAAKYQGTALLYAEIGLDGAAHNIKVCRGLGLGLDEKAIQAIGLWKFKPASKDGQPVIVAVSIEVNFRLL